MNFKEKSELLVPVLRINVISNFGVPFSLHGFPAPFRRRFPALPLGGHRRVSHADGHAVFKVQQAKRQQKSRHKTDQPCLRFFWKVMLVGYVTAESQDVQPRRI